MSAEDKSRKTEKATPHKLRQARRKGQVSKSKEVVAAAGIILIFGVIWGGRDFFFGQMLETFMLIFELSELPGDEAMPRAIERLVDLGLLVCLPIIMLGVVAAVVASVAQFGFLFSVHPVTPDPQRINPISGFKNLVSVKRLVESGKAIVKIGVIGTVAWALIYYSVQDFVLMPYCGVSCILAVTERILRILLLVMIPLFIVIAILDFVFQKQQFLKENRMTKEELKRDFKDTQGNPEVKQQRRRTQREILEENLSQAIERTTVLIVGNDTVIGLRYVKGETSVPEITLKERKMIAGQAIRKAVAADIPVERDPLLCRQLWGDVQPGDAVPKTSFKAIARILVRIGAL